jgi:cytoskeletal protein CcmA (bactofilin family)
VVGRGITFSGEIKSCDYLVVEGTVRANIVGCEGIQIAEGGLFTGSASVGSTEIRGQFEGELAVSGRLLICASGKVTARVRYHQIEIERGGQISGEIEADEGLAHNHGASPLPMRA